ncbi:ABC transporter ATP-binding protein [Leucobacter rhizosphaerae]|uniref:ABC transporter ATP-binding protein n=1 Tax=Leucobacter rhizosphaerae TaxID=2932245 RepID=A0ABY4FTX8_9MICO|nr:ABC transporter ATP-binding protein [Leucobacter rhizosphaerae]UOQ59715.1 ABC transporter ATP-binding protein [Leucobacter rhizosphaerae]
MTAHAHASSAPDPAAASDASATPRAATLLSVRDLTVAYATEQGPVTAVSGVSFDVRPGECVALVGESGSGKTTVGRALLGLLPRDTRVVAERLEVAGRDARGFRDRDWRAVRGGEVGLVLQDALVSLDPLRTIGQEVSEAMRAGTRPRTRAARRAEVVQRLAQAGLPDAESRSRQYAHQLSGGQRQRALIATAVAGDPGVLIADEPTTALDVTVQRQVIDLLREKRRAGLGLVLISHDLAVVAEIADRVLVMRGGEVVEQGAPAEVLSHPKHAYTRALIAAVPGDGAGSPAEGPVDGQDRPAASAQGSSAGAAVLVADGLRVEYRTPGHDAPRIGLDDVSLEVRRGRALGIVGESGSGKSTLLRVLLALQEPSAGSVQLDGAPWSGIPETQRRERRPRLQLVAQDPLSAFNPRFDVRQVIGEALGRCPAAEREGRIAEVLDAVSLPRTVLDRHPLQLSGGQRQRVAIARALAAEPEVLFCDEAVSALDVVIQAQILELLGDLQRSRGLSIVFVSHDLGVIAQLCDDVIVLQNGAVVESGPVESVYGAPQHPYTRALLEARPLLGAA